MSQTQQLSPSDSMEQVNDGKKDDKKPKTRRPPNTAFRQQRLKAWQPILTPKTVLPLFFIVGIIFAPIGGLLLYASTQVQEISIEYTNCGAQAPTTSPLPIPDGRVSYSFSSSNASDLMASNPVKWSKNITRVPYGAASANYFVPTNTCTVQFYLPNELKAPVYLYYRLSDFYQNHRRYVKSFDQDQLNGDFRSNSTITDSNCDPLETNGTHAYYPCGLIANSLFNDTIFSPINLTPTDGSDGNYSMTTKGIAWASDASLYGNTSYKPYEVAPPPDWIKRYPSGYNAEFPLPDLNNDEGFQVWMRTAGLPYFSKLARRNDQDTMSPGTYNITIYDNFPSELYGGKKEILLSTRTVIGGKNPFLGIAYIVVGGVCILLGAIFTAVHLVKPRKLGDHTYLTWNNDQPTSATTTGRNLGGA